MSAAYFPSSAQDRPCTPSGSAKRFDRRNLRQTFPSSSPLASTDNHAYGITADPLRSDVGNTLVSDDLGSPSTSKTYPISPNMSEYLRNRRERFFLNDANDGSRTRTRQGRASHGTNEHGGDRLSSSNGISAADRRVGPHISPFARSSTSTSSENEASSSRVLRQQFRQRCQAAMARDRQRDRERRLQDVRNGDAISQDDGGTAFARSDELYSSDMDDVSSTINSDAWTEVEEDEEMMRRIMTAEYRRMLRDQERQGEWALGWLGPDEVAWLEEEMRKEEQGSSSSVEIEPPPDLVDEDEMLCAMYEEAYRQSMKDGQGTKQDLFETGEDFSWVHEVDLNFDMDDEMAMED